MNFKDANVAQRMSWASERKTTRVEDEAYCLMGIFGVHMPLIYGEGENAFIRLQLEIMKNSDDDSLFAWEDLNAETCGLLAPSPASFKNSADVIRVHSDSLRRPPYAMTNKGLQITFFILPVQQSESPSYRRRIEKDEGLYLACLNCYREGQENSLLLLLLLGTKDQEQPFSRVPRRPLIYRTYNEWNENTEWIVVGESKDVFVRRAIYVIQPQVASRVRQPFIYWVDHSSVFQAGFTIKSEHGSWMTRNSEKSILRLHEVGDNAVLHFSDGQEDFSLHITLSPNAKGNGSVGEFDFSDLSLRLGERPAIELTEERREFLKSGRVVVGRMDKKTRSFTRPLSSMAFLTSDTEGETMGTLRLTRPRFLIKLEVETPW